LTERQYYLWNIGCQMNRADAQRLEEELGRRGLAPTRQPERADILVLNTCVVRQSAEDKVLGRLASLSSIKRQHPERALIVMGCFVDDESALASRFPYVDAFFRPSDVAGVVAYLEARDGDLREANPCVPATPVSDLVPISYGCNRHCTYCIVTIRRGPEVSRPVDEIVAEVEDHVARGAREVTLLGQNVDSYGGDLPGRPDLSDVLQAIHGLNDLWRIRFLTSHPGDMSQRIIDVATALPKVGESWELPVQSGNDTVLRRMARGYTVARYRDLVARIRAADPASAINTDVIVGFPGETEEQFEDTLRLVEEIRFDVVHVAAYSVRPGTPAANWPDDVSPEEKERRRAAVEAAQTRIAGEISATLLGRTVEVLVDGRQRGRWRGRTRTNKLVFFEDAGAWLGRLAQVRVTWAGPWSLIGEAEP
jgi:tRNA-2-methylthio-N6-dimethylallyladenosine synthase